MTSLLLLLLAGCSQGDLPPETDTDDTDTDTDTDSDTDTIDDTGAPALIPNVIVVLWDDVGVENVALYDDAAETPVSTPVFDALASEGVLFERAWAYPVCSPTRASILTGRHPYRHGIGKGLDGSEEHGLPYEEFIIPEQLDRAGDWGHAVAGKWHLASRNQDYTYHPLIHGFHRHRGPMANPKDGYRDWKKNVDGTLEQATHYLTGDTVDEAILAAKELEEPFFLWVAFNAPHAPYHTPPNGTYTWPVDPSDPVSKYKAMVESADTATGLVLDGLSPEVRERTMVIVLGDNGTPTNATAGPVPPSQAKTTVFEGGIRVPMVIAGPLVKDGGRRVSHLVQATDLYPTILEWAKAPLPNTTIDGVSLAPLLLDKDAPAPHTTIYSESFSFIDEPTPDSWQRAIRNDRYKLITMPGERAFYDLQSHWLEGVNLLSNAHTLTVQEQSELAALEAALQTHAP